MSGFRLTEEITYWTQASQTVDGGTNWDAPVLIDAKIADHVEEIIDPEGKSAVTKRAIYTRTNLPPGTYVVEGDETASATPLDVSGAERVILSIKIASMSDMNKVMV
ncbi:MAG: hypothetical protein KAJ19_10490 [Gammaproteobacteria bacterium]|nr:hypothetical protein [Gammaproteobacteria bacterium]